MIRLARGAAVVLAFVSVAFMASGLLALMLPGQGQIPDRPSAADVLIFSLIFVTFPTVGAALAWMRPHHPIGWLFIAVALAIAVSVGSTEYAGRAAFLGEDLPAAELFAWAGTWTWLVGAGIALPLAVILFPDGRLPGPRWRPVVTVLVLAVGVLVFSQATLPGPLAGYGGHLPNPFAIGDPLGSLLIPLVPLGTLGIAVMGLLAVAALTVRFRRSDGQERQQIKWLLWPASLFLMGFAGTIVRSDSLAWSLSLMALVGFPIGVAIAILRHRLFDIDVVIRRTIVYGVLVAILGTVYVALVVGSQAAFAMMTGGTTLPIAISTLGTAALFGPVRRRVHEAVDRRFYRSRYDSQRTLEQFGGRLRDQVDLDTVGRSLADVAAQAVRPASVGVWLRRQVGE